MKSTSSIATMILVFGCCVAPATLAAEPPAAAARLSQPGPEELSLRAQTGTWSVVATMWPTAGGEPVVTRGLVAERVMIGAYLQETMRPVAGSAEPDFRRIDYLNFDRVEGRWKYVSLDTRFPVSIMPATSFDPGSATSIRMLFAPQAFVGFGKDVEGRFMQMGMTIESPDAAHQVKEQAANMATGDGRPRIFVRYEYSRLR